MDELQARAKLANVHVSDDGALGAEQSALKARDLGVAFADPDSPVRDQRPSGMTLMSNSPDAFKGREIRVSHAAGVRFDDRTTNREEFPAHPVSPANYGNGVRKAYAPSSVKFEGTTTMREEYPAHPVSPTPSVAKKPYRMYEAKFDDRTTNREEFPAHPVSPPNYGNGVRKAYAPSPVKFEGTTTMREEYPAHPVSPTPSVAKKPYRMYEAKFDDRTTNREEFPAHPVSPPNYGNGVRKAYAPSPVKFEGKTTAQEEYPAHVIVAKRPPVGLWVENDRTEILVHSGRELPARVSRVFSTTEHGQTAVAVRIVQGWSRKASENARLGVFEMTGIAPGPPGKAQIKVTFDLDENGVLTVTGEDKESGQTQQAQTQTMDK